MNILITGISRGLGLEVVKTLLKDKKNHIWGISRVKTPELKLLLEKNRHRLHWLDYDLEDSENIRPRIFKEFIGTSNPIHAFINNAAIAYDDIITNINNPYLHKMFNINVITPMVLTKYVIRHFILHKTKGAIVHMSSISVHTGYKGLAMYASTKGALEAFSKNTAREWGELGIRSNSVVAGFMETDMSSSLSQDQKDKIYRRTSLKQPVLTRSVSETISFLISEKAASITGQNVFVDCGTI